MFKDVKEFVIDRECWFRGHGQEKDAYLLNEDDDKCCLGFYAMACGHDEMDIRGLQTPEDLSEPWNTFLLKPSDDEINSPKNSDICTKLMDINDNPGLNEVEREELIAEKFARLGVIVKFTG